MTDFPTFALSVRQPWAWAIIFGGKDIENRSWQAVNHGLRQRGRIAIHASKGMTREEYEDARDFMAGLGPHSCIPPLPAALDRGCIIGSVEVVDVVTEHNSPWFMGERGLVLKDPRPCTPIPVAGALGYFAWTARNDWKHLPPAPKWMKNWQPEAAPDVGLFPPHHGD